MISNRLSRWTLPMFATALANFLAAMGLLLSGSTWPAQALLSPGTLAAMHLLAIGWLLLLMLGALYQFVPVITSRALASQPLALASLIIIEAGLAGMIGGFYGIAAGAPRLAVALPAGGATVVLGVLVACANIAVPLLRTRPLPLPGRMVLTGLAFLLLTVALGLSFALALTVPRLAAHLSPLLGEVGDHALAGLGGWFTLTAMGVSYKLLPMFMLAPEERGVVGKSVHGLATVGFALAIAAGIARLWLPAAPLRFALWVAYAAIVAAVALYLWDVRRIYRTRKRAIIEAHNRAAVAAFGFLGLGTLLAIGLAAAGRLTEGWPVIVFLVVFGWLGGLGLTQLYKIIPFLTWLSRYGSHLGRGAVPRVQDLVRERRSYPWFVLYFLGVLLGTAAALAGSELGLRACVALVALATLGLIAEYWRAWRGHYASQPRVSSAAPPFLPNQRG